MAEHDNRVRHQRGGMYFEDFVVGQPLRASAHAAR